MIIFLIYVGTRSPSSRDLGKTDVELFAALKENCHWTRWYLFGCGRIKQKFCKIWNLALKFSTGPSSWKIAHITPLLKVDVPKRKRDYRRINITPVIAYTIEKCRYITSTSTVEQHLSLTQFATRTGRAIQIHA